MAKGKKEIVVLKSRDNVSRVVEQYEQFDSTATKAEYERLDTALKGLAGHVASGIDGMVSHLSEMQALLSQRGEQRRSVLVAAGCPSWTDYLQEYTATFEISMRTIQRKVRQFRNPQASQRQGERSLPASAELTVPDEQERSRSVRRDRDARTSGSTVPASSESDSALSETGTPQPDWKAILKDLLSLLRRYDELLPVEIKSEAETIFRMTAQAGD